MVLFNVKDARSARKYRAWVLILLTLGQEAGAMINSTSTPPPSTSNFRKPKESSFMAKAATQSNEIDHTQSNEIVIDVSSNFRFENDTVSARRLTVLAAQFKTEAALGHGVADNMNIFSNIQANPLTADNIVVTAGVKYPKFGITAQSGLGVDASLIKVKLVTSEMGITTCENALSEMSDPPFNGAVNVISGSPMAIYNEFANVRFPRAGVYKLCYTRDSKKWEELTKPTITVVGAKSSTIKVFCSRTVMAKDKCVDPTLPGCSCKGRIDGFHWQASSSTMLKTGLPNPITVAPAVTISPPGKTPDNSVWLAKTNNPVKKCGEGAFANAVQGGDPFGQTISKVTNADGYEVHDFGAERENVQLRTWIICYCANFNADVASQQTKACSTDERDYPQLVGHIITVDVQTRMGATEVTVYPTLKFSLVMRCGYEDGKGDGGCESDKKVRYKVVESKPENDNLYFEDSSGCRFLEQAKSQVIGKKVVGGHIGPENCKAAASCHDEPEVESQKTPTWDGVQLDASYHNSIMVQKTFDVCYCDKNCENSANWFKAGEIDVKPVKVNMQDTNENDVLTPVVNTNYFVEVKGDKPGSWSTTGAKTREMKILSDTGGLVDKDACLTQEQPPIVSGHSMGTGPTDYAEPSHPRIDAATQRVVGFKYGEVRSDISDPNTAKPNIKIQNAGWVAVCYCDSECNQRTNWAVFGRILIRGPKPNQAWTRTAEVPFDLEVTGWGLHSDNRLIIIDPSNGLSDCGQTAQSTKVFGPIGSNPMGTAVMKPGAALDKMERDPAGFGTIITFQTNHGLKDGDVIELSGVSYNAASSVSLTEKVAMFNSAHEVFVVCDVPGKAPTFCSKILIHVVFSSLEFPGGNILNVQSASWMKISEQKYEKIKILDASPDGRGYVVCWSQKEDSETLNKDGSLKSNFYVGQVGKITVKEPVEMKSVESSIVGGSALLSLTTLQASTADNPVVAPIIVTFNAGDRAQYRMSENSMQLKLVFRAQSNLDGSITKALIPHAWDGAGLAEDETTDELHEAHQAVCGKLFLEMWTNAPRGFPQPKGCYLNRDWTQNPKKETATEALGLWQLYIVFNAKNHLTGGYQYQLVMMGEALDELSTLIPDTGAVHVWSMDDTVTNINGVVERGKAFPMQKRTPKDAADAAPADPHFHDDNGFLVKPDEQNKGIMEMKRYCMASDGTATTPHESIHNTGGTTDGTCRTCESEADCRRPGDDPDFVYTWCVSPIDKNCKQVPGGDLTRAPAFTITLRGKQGAPIIKQTILRLFMRPYTQWRLGTSCTVRMDKLHGKTCSPTGYKCGDMQCETETAVKGKQQGATDLQINVIKMSLPDGMPAAIMHGDSQTAEIAIGNLPLPPGGFFPSLIVAELQKTAGMNPVYFGKLAKNGGKLFYKPRFTIAAVVTKVGDGDLNRFISLQDAFEINTVYVKLVSGATLFSPQIGDLTLDVVIPEDYKCLMVNVPGKPAPASLKVFEDLDPLVPNGNGTLGGHLDSWAAEGEWTSPQAKEPPECSFEFKKEMIVFAGASIYFELVVQNPKTPRQKYDTKIINNWSLNAAKKDTGATHKAHTTAFAEPKYKSDYTKDVKKFGENFGPNLSVLGKLKSVIISPSNFGVGQTNMMTIFLKTEQAVGTKTHRHTEIWVDAPPGYDFGQVCKVEHLDKNYYVPVEPPQIPTRKIPTGPDVIMCNGGLSRVGELTYNRAKVRTTGRLAQGTSYGFALRVTNGHTYSKYATDGWKVWTYMFAGEEKVAAVDGTFEPIPFYQNSPSMTRGFTTERRMNFGTYQRNIPSYNFGIHVDDLRPSASSSARRLEHSAFSTVGSTTKITIFPLILGDFSDKNVRIIAPAGFKWDFEQVDFKYRSKLTGAPEGEYVEGAEADIPLSLVPTRPIAEPFNELKIDYMKAAWKPNTKYGFSARLRVPERSPTASSNTFTIEFGYDQDEIENRLEAGSSDAKMVQKLINGAVDYRTNIAGQNNTIIFSIQTITKIEFTGGLVISGPPLFAFNRTNPAFGGSCTPKPLEGYPEMPSDSTCTFEPDPRDGRPNITITAGHSGIPVAMYRFYLEATNPKKVYTAKERGVWDFNAYKLVSTRTPLDAGTQVPGFLINDEMSLGNLVEARFQECTFREQLDALAQALAETRECDFEDWQYHEPYGLRNDRPGKKNQLIFTFRLKKDPPADEVMIIRAPEGFIFDTECQVVSDESKVFNAINTDGDPPDGFSSTSKSPDSGYTRGYTRWTKDGAVVTKCEGDKNKAMLTISAGLKKFMKYVFRIGVTNPIRTPVPNNFIIEYNGESSEPFAGFEMWAFTDGEIIPEARGVSLREAVYEEDHDCNSSDDEKKIITLERRQPGDNCDHTHNSIRATPLQSTMNEVSIQFRPFNTIPIGGRIRIFAPSGFVIATNCEVKMHLHESSEEAQKVVDKMNSAAKTAYHQWAKFDEPCPKGDDWSSPAKKDCPLMCKGETKPTNQAEVRLLQSKIIKAKKLYIMKLMVVNPQSMTSARHLWYFESYEDNTPDKSLDAAYIPGFPINYLVPQFSFLPPTSKNALAFNFLEFTMGFPQTVIFGDTLNIIAPVGYYFSTTGNKRCVGYKHINGPLTRTQPTCSANMITWTIVDERVPPSQDITFIVRIQNPESTPKPNLFRCRQLSSTGVQKSSKVIPGYLIIPELRDVRITNVYALHPCRPEINVITQHPCTATDSFATIGVEFTPVTPAEYARVQGHVGGQHFSFLKSTAITDDGMVYTTLATTETYFLMKSPFKTGIIAHWGIDHVQIPPISGVSYWSVTTYMPLSAERLLENPSYEKATPQLCSSYDPVIAQLCPIPNEDDRADEKLELEYGGTNFEIQRFNEVLASTSVTPQYYKEMGATVRFEVKMGRTVGIGDIIAITRPSNYTILEVPKIQSYQKGVKIGEAGLDSFRRWSTGWENPETYYFVMESQIEEMELFSFNFKANLPAVPEMQRHWVIRSFKLLPVLDEDGNIVDDSQAPYPWLNRELKETSTNDGAFAGFSLIGKIPFNIVPERQTPGARVVLTLTFGLEAQIVAQNPDGIKVVLYAPSGFRFEASCRQGTSTQFRQCIGINNQARLVASTKRLVGTNIQLGIAAYNPTETPEFNRWQLELYKDVPISSKQYSNKSEWDGYEITPMLVIYRGNNQIAEPGFGFFSFTPVRELTRRGFIDVSPPEGVGYQLNCQGVRTISLPQTPLCISEEADRPLRLELTNSTLKVGKTYTFGVGVTNPGAKVPPDQNKWGVMLKDVDLNAIDGNMKVDGLELKAIPLRVTNIGWSSAEAQAMARIMIGMIVLSPISPGTIDEIRIVSPEGVMYSDPSSVKIGPDALPLVDNQPISIEGNNVKIKIKKDMKISNGAYNIQFQVKNPSNLPPDNTWMVFAMKGKQEVLTHVLAGYNYGQASDIEVAQIAAAAGACRLHDYNVAVLLQVLAATALRYLW